MTILPPLTFYHTINLMITSLAFLPFKSLYSIPTLIIRPIEHEKSILFKIISVQRLIC